MSLGGGSATSTIMNNQFSKGGIFLYDTLPDVVIKGNTFSKADCGLYLKEVMNYPQVTRNTFKYCGYGVYIYTDGYPGKLTSFSGNTYYKNKVNIGWGTDY